MKLVSLQRKWPHSFRRQCTGKCFQCSGCNVSLICTQYLTKTVQTQNFWIFLQMTIRWLNDQHVCDSKECEHLCSFAKFSKILGLRWPRAVLSADWGGGHVVVSLIVTRGFTIRNSETSERVWIALIKHSGVFNAVAVKPLHANQALKVTFIWSYMGFAAGFCDSKPGAAGLHGFPVLRRWRRNALCCSSPQRSSWRQGSYPGWEKTEEGWTGLTLQSTKFYRLTDRTFTRNFQLKHSVSSTACLLRPSYAHSLSVFACRSDQNVWCNAIQF